MKVTAMFYKSFYLALFLISFAIAGYTIQVGSQNVTYGAKVAELEHQQTTLSEQKNAMLRQISQASSLSGLTAVAEAQGYTLDHHILTVATTQPVALR
jgi:cell division protein FtsL